MVNVRIEPPNSVILVVAREDFSPPSTFAGRTCAATSDCIAIGVRSVDDGATVVSFAAPGQRPDLMPLGEFVVISEGNLSVRSIYNREHLTAGVEVGAVTVEVLGNDAAEPDEVVLVIRP